MKLIRNGTFETNSSSTHAIAIVKNNSYKVPKNVNFNFGEFGWEYAVYKETSDKASYLYTMIQYFDGEYVADFDKKDGYISKMKEYLDEEGITYKFEEPTVSDYGWSEHGYVDHGAYNPDIIENILKDKETFFRFLFDERSYVSTGNDNDRGYYIPGIGYSSGDDYWENYEKLEKEWNNKMKDLEKEYDIYFKGN